MIHAEADFSNNELPGYFEDGDKSLLDLIDSVGYSFKLVVKYPKHQMYELWAHWFCRFMAFK